MKKFIYRTTSLGAVILAFGNLTMAQAPTPPPPPPGGPAGGKGEQTEVIIRQKGDKDTKLTLEIKNGEFFINGKPLEKFDDQNVIVEKRESDMDMDGANVYVSPFRENFQDQENAQREYRDAQREYNNAQREFNNEDIQRRIQKSFQIETNAAFLGVSSRKAETGGATVLEVTKGSPAEKAGIKTGDIITKVNDSTIKSPDKLFETIHNFKPGDKVKIVFTRDGKMQTVTATLDKSEYMPRNYNYNYKFKMPPMPDMRGMQNNMWGEEMWKQPKLGIKAQDAEDGKGVNILDVEDSSAAFKAGLKKGDIILQFDGSDVNSTPELVELFEDARKKSIIKVKILRGGVSQEVEIKIPRKLKTAEL